jgi:hypothetical protein
MPPAGLEPTIPVSKRPQTHALDLTDALQNEIANIDVQTLHKVSTSRVQCIRACTPLRGHSENYESNCVEKKWHITSTENLVKRLMIHSVRSDAEIK